MPSMVVHHQDQIDSNFCAGFLLTPRQRLTAILDSGITVFYALQVCLTAMSA